VSICVSIFVCVCMFICVYLCVSVRVMYTIFHLLTFGAWARWERGDGGRENGNQSFLSSVSQNVWQCMLQRGRKRDTHVSV